MNPQVSSFNEMNNFQREMLIRLLMRLKLTDLFKSDQNKTIF